MSSVKNSCHGPPSRRDMLRIGGLSALGLGLTDLFAKPAVAQAATAKSCILIWLDGGPSHLETFDVKPNAPAEVRGPFRTIATAVPGIEISECLPMTAQVMKHVCVVRSMTSPLGEHGLANHYMLTGYQPTPVLQYPSYGAVLAHERGERSVLPSYISVPEAGPMAGAGYLGNSWGPFAVGADPAKPDFQVRDLDFYAGVTPERMERRQSFVKQLDQLQQQVESTPPSDATFEQALRLITSPAAKQAFDLSQESAATRARYGPRTIGQSCLLARRLVERGVPFVTVHNPGWDTHNDLVLRLKEGYAGAVVGVGLIPMFDRAFAALVGDLQERGLLDQTLVIAMGEFGRTPKINTARGRDHWPRVFSLALAGGGIRGGQVYGSSDRVGESPADKPMTPADLAATVYTLLGVNPAHELQTADGRPVRINSGGNVIRELMA